MKKILLLIFITSIMFAFTNKGQAQTQIGFSAGQTTPFGDFGDAVDLGFGGGIHFKNFLSDKFALGFNAGYYSFAGKDEGPSFGIIPLSLSAEYYFKTEGFKPYVSLEPTVYLFDNEFQNGIKTSDLGLAPGVGFSYGLSDLIDLNVNAEYNIVFTTNKGIGADNSVSYLGINVGLLFSFD